MTGHRERSAARCPDGGDLILFGAFDRHNYGDLLLARLAAEGAGGRSVHFAGLRAWDARAVAGFAVRPLPEVLADLTPGGYDLRHVGGEILDCDAWSAAVMLLDEEHATRLIARFDADLCARRREAARRLGTHRPLPYVLRRRDVPGVRRLEFAPCGGTGLDTLPRSVQRAALAALAEADEASVRDARTRAFFAERGLALPLAPDPAEELAASHLAAALEAHAADWRARLGAYRLVQFAAECATDPWLASLAAWLEARREAGERLALVRAGGAPWHDTLEALGRLSRFLSPSSRAVLCLIDELQLEAIGGLAAAAVEVCATSLHLLLTARAFAVPAVALEREPHAARKLRAYFGTWHPEQTVWAPGFACRPVGRFSVE
ncbi:MAG: polysaccharide pyruvyl transferase family protein [Rhodocyclales bacterium]|nr:polysaccharide pyruvyl transferase family protein [Rhodocyclales bacterium]